MSNVTNLTVAIIGANGFVGSHIAKEVLRRGWNVASIGSKTTEDEAASVMREADAVVHSVGAFLPDRRYKDLLSRRATVSSLTRLAALRFGWLRPSPLERSLDEINRGTVEKYAKLLVKEKEALIEKPQPNYEHPLYKQPIPAVQRIPFVFISASQWTLADPAYIASKRRAEEFLAQQPGLRGVFLRPGMIAPPRAKQCSEVTPRHLIDVGLQLSKSDARVSVESVAIAACDAIETPNIEGPIDRHVLRELDSST